MPLSMGSRVKTASTTYEWQAIEKEARDLGKAVCVDFWADFCGPCRMMAPIFEQLSEKYQKTYVFVKVEASTDIARSNGIRSLPTFQIWRRGVKVAEKLGADPRFEAWLQEHDSPVPTSFTGAGRTLGGGDAASGRPTAPAPAQAASSGTQQGLDGSKPTTNLQFRLLDGSKLSGTFNTDATVADLRTYIASMRPQAAQKYVLMTTYPARKLEDDSATLASLDVANCVLTQRPQS